MMRRRTRTRVGLPLEPWRFVLVAISIGLAIPMGYFAAQPVLVGDVELHVWNGADLGVLICVAIFVAAFAIRSKGEQ